jgi:competence protein ComEC
VSTTLAALIWLLSWGFAPKDSESQIKLNYPEVGFISYLRERFLLSLNGVNSDASGLVAGLTIGERSLLSEAVEAEMKTLSLTHLVAVSGANLAIIVGAIYFLCAGLGLPRNIRYLTALIAMSGYVLLVGPESSVIRAATMALFVMVGLWLGRGSSALNSLSLAIVVLLMVDPGLATDIGFALSAFATAGLLIMAAPMFEWLRQYLPDVVAMGVAASASAQLFTTPVLLVLQPSIPLYSVLANLMVEPVVAPITILGILSVLVSVVNIPLAGGVSYLASLMANWIVIVAQELSSWPAARLHFVKGAFGILLVALVVALLALSFGILKPAARQLRITAALTSLLAISWSATDQIRHTNFASDSALLVCDVGQGDALVLRDSGQVVLVDVGGQDELIDKCLSNAGVDRIDLLVLTHFDADHVAGIRGALQNREVGLVLVSGFEDDRPLVSIVHQELASAGALIEIGRTGLVGNLGRFHWKILQPSSNAVESSDSNDASLIFAAWDDTYSVLALGDLGESGQLRLMRNAAHDLAILRSRNLIVKVAHHGSADQSTELYEYLSPVAGIFSVGKNDYGHPAPSALSMLERTGATVLRTDQLGPIALDLEVSLEIRSGGKLTT